MKKNLFLLPVLIAGLGLLLTGRGTAQTFTTLYNFTATDPASGTNNDGATPYAGLIMSGNTLYGTAKYGGSPGYGTVFAINTDGTGFTNLHSFVGYPSDGLFPLAGLILSGNTLYGTTVSGPGTVFAVTTDGTGFTNLYSLTPFDSEYANPDGGNPYAGLILSGGTLYGTAASGGTYQNGTVFKVSTHGTGFTVLHTFTGPHSDVSSPPNSDGASPTAGLLVSGNTLYGTAQKGGRSGYGTVFGVHTDGTGFTNVHSFSALDPNYYTNSDGVTPYAGLILSGNTLYGTAIAGGGAGVGTVFAVNTDGSGFVNLHSFTASSGSYPSYTNSDGAYPEAGLILSGNTLFGTTTTGGSSGNGTVFAVNTDGTGFTNLYIFTASSTNASGVYTNSDGAHPVAGLLLTNNTLYGTASAGGISGYGTVFSLSLGSVSTPQLTIIRSAANVVLTWPTNAAGLTLQSTTNLGSSVVWATVSPAPVVVSGENTVTNPISGTQQFYRLINP